MDLKEERQALLVLVSTARVLFIYRDLKEERQALLGLVSTA